VIDHATAVGIAEDKIAKAEAALEQHKATRKREAFEAELRDFLESEECEDLEACEEKEQQGIKFGVSDKGLAALREKIEDLNRRKDLADEEVAQAKLYLEVHCRRFVKSAVKGRSGIWIDVASGKKQRVNLSLDLTLHNLTVTKSSGDSAQLASCSLDRCSAVRASDTEEMQEAVGQLSETELECAVVIFGDSSPWLLVEEDAAKVDEIIVGVLMLGGGAAGDAPAASASSSSKKGGKKKGGKKGAAPEIPEVAAVAEDGEADNAGENPISPRGGADNPPASARGPPKKEEKKEKKGKKDKKEKKSKADDEGED